MTSKVKTIFTLTIFLLALFLSLKADSPPALGGEEKKIKDIAKKVYPSVVKVEARNRIRKVATGVVIDKNGYIVTTALISPRDEKISVITSKGERIEAEFLGMDSETHLALIKAKDKKLVPIAIGGTKKLSPGSWIGVISISPENMPAITQGIVSSISPDWLRLNVWVVRGSSGSPVVDSNGHMVGLLRGVYSNEEPVIVEFREKELVASGFVFSKAEAPSSGLAIGIPVEVVENVTSEIKEKGRVERGWLGVYIDENDVGKVEIVDVEEESPAELAKLERGDIILKLEGKDVTSTEMLAREIRKRKPGENVTLKIERDGKIRDVKVRLGEYSVKDVRRELEFKFPQLFVPKPPEPPEPPEPAKPRIFRWGWESRKYIGVYLEEINRELAEHFGVKEGRGLLISKISKDSPVEKAGLKVGDVIIQADGVRIERVRDLSELIQDKGKGDKIKIEFLRDKKKRSVEVEIEEEESGTFFYSNKEWKDYVDSWNKYSENLKKKYKEYKDRYSQNFQKYLKRMNKEIEEATRNSKEAAKKARLALKKHIAVKV